MGFIWQLTVHFTKRRRWEIANSHFGFRYSHFLNLFRSRLLVASIQTSSHDSSTWTTHSGDVYPEAACYGRVVGQYCGAIGSMVETQTLLFSCLKLHAISPGWAKDSPSSHSLQTSYPTTYEFHRTEIFHSPAFCPSSEFLQPLFTAGP